MNNQNKIKFCPECGHNSFHEQATDSIDWTICEAVVVCNHCAAIVNYYFYGSYENDFSEKYKIMLRKKKLERLNAKTC